MILILIRHGEVDYKSSNNPALTELGKNQAEILAKHFQEYNFKEIHSSTLLRTKETCYEISKYHKNVPIFSNDLKEISEYFSSKDEKEFFKILTYISKIKAKKNDKIIFVVHGHLIRLIISDILEVPFENLQKIDIFPGSITIVSYNSKKNKIITVNSYHHLPKGARSKK